MGSVFKAIGKLFSSTFGQIFLGILGIVGFGLGGWWLILGGGAVLGSLAGGYYRNQQAKKALTKLRSSSTGHLVNTRSSNEELPLVYGTCRVGGNVIFMHTDSWHNNVLWQVISLSEANIHNVLAVYMNEDQITFDEPNVIKKASTSLYQVQITDSDIQAVQFLLTYFKEYESSYGGNPHTYMAHGESIQYIAKGTTKYTDEGDVKIEFKSTGLIEVTRITAGHNIVNFLVLAVSKDGASYSTKSEGIKDSFHWCANLGNDIIGDGGVHAALIERGFKAPANVAYIGLKLVYDPDIYQSIPNITALLRGIRCLNVVTGRVDHTDNPAIILYDYLTNARYGLGIDPTRIDEVSWTEVINYCERRGWRFNGVITDGRASDIVQQLQDHFLGTVIYRDGKFQLKYNDMREETPVAHVRESDMVEDSFLMEIPARTEIPNTCKVNFLNAAVNYKVDSVTQTAPDAGADEEPRVLEIDLYGSHQSQALNLGQHYLERARLNTVCTFTVTHEYLTFRLSDLIYVSYAPYGIDSEIFRITSLEPAAEGLINVGAVIDNEVLYLYGKQLDDIDFDLSHLPAPNERPPTVVAVLEEILQTDDEGMVRTLVKVSWDTIGGLIDHYQVWTQDTSEGEWEHLRNAKEPPVYFRASEVSTTYLVKIIPVTVLGVKPKATAPPISQITTNGIQFDPDAVLQPGIVTELRAEVIDNNVLLYWKGHPGRLAIRYYEIRKGNVFATAQILGTADVTFKALFESKGGTYRYWVVTVDERGNRSEEESITVKVDEPPDFIAFADVESKWRGTKTNFFVFPDMTAMSPAYITGVTWADHFTSAGYDQIQDFITAGYTYFVTPVPNTGSYEEVFEFGQGGGMKFGDEFGGLFGGGTEITIAAINLELDYDFYDAEITITPTISVSTDYTNWTVFNDTYSIRAGSIVFVKVRLDFNNAGSGDFVLLNRLRVRLNVKLKADSGNDTVTTASTGKVVNFNISYFDIDSITASPRGNGSAVVTPIIDFTDAPNPTGFTVYLLDVNGTKITGDFYWHARGI